MHGLCTHDTHVHPPTQVGTQVYPGATSDSSTSESNITFSTFTYTIHVQRPVFEGVITHFVPPAIILAPTLYSYLLDPVAHWQTRVSIGAGGLMSTVFFHSSIAGQLPTLDYLTLFDKYIFCVYVCILAQLLSSFGVIFLFRREAEAPEDMSPFLKEVLYSVSLRTLAGSVVGLFVVFLPLWMLVSSYTAIVMLAAAGIAAGLWILSTFADAKAYDALHQPLTALAGQDTHGHRSADGRGFGGSGVEKNVLREAGREV